MRGLPILTFHAIDDGGDVLATSPSEFRRLLARLDAEGFLCVDLHDWIASGRPDPGRAFALAFDDGLLSIRLAAEAIAARGFLATAFLVPVFMGGDTGWPGQPRGIRRRPILSWSDLPDLRRAGFRFAAHTMTHPHLNECGPESACGEILGSRAAIERETGGPCPLFAYPYGETTGPSRAIVKGSFAAGFGTRLAYASASDPIEMLPRVDAYYLRSPRAVRGLIEGTWPRLLGLRRIARSARRAGQALARAGLSRPRSAA